MGTFLQALQPSIRRLIREPAFTATVVLTLAVGIGATTTVFSAVNGVILRSLPYDRPEQLVQVWEADPSNGWSATPLSPATFGDLERRSGLLEQVAAVSFRRFTVTGGGDPAAIDGARASPSFFELLGVRPAVGRADLTHDAASSPPVVLSHELWRSRFGGDNEVLGRALTIDGVPHVVAGVLPPRSGYPPTADLWIPLAPPAGDSRALRNLGVVARLRPSATLDQAQTELAARAAQIRDESPELSSDWSLHLTPLTEELFGASRRQLLVLFGAVLFVLLLATVNAANLMIGHAVVRRKELAIRTAVGARSGQVGRQLLAESLLLSLLAGIGGVLLAVWGRHLMTAAIPSHLVGLLEIEIDGRVLAFTLLVSICLGIACGLAPLREARRSHVSELLNAERSRSSRRGRRVRSLLAVSEVALAVLLLTGTGLMIKSVLRLLGVDPGFESRGVVTADIALPDSKYSDPPRIALFYRRVLEELEALPQVSDAAVTSALPLTGAFLWGPVRTGDGVAAGTDDELYALGDMASPGYFRALGIELLRGRFFVEGDRDGARPVAIVNETLARRLSPDGDPVGRQIRFGPTEAEVLTVVGVVDDVRQLGLHRDVLPHVYLSFLQFPGRNMTIAVKSDAATTPGLTDALRQRVWEVDPAQPLMSLRPLDELFSDTIARPRWATSLMGFFGFIALVLATTGVYSVVSFAVRQRTSEIGIRMALGAERRDVFRMVLRQGAALALLGIVLGLSAAAVLTRFLSTFLYSVHALDPAIFAGGALGLLVLVLLGCYFPARRAVAVDPMEVIPH